MPPYRLPIKFILLWIVNLVLVFAADSLLGLRNHMQLKNVATIYLTVSGILALLEQALFDRIRGN